MDTKAIAAELWCTIIGYDKPKEYETNGWSAATRQRFESAIERLMMRPECKPEPVFAPMVGDYVRYQNNGAWLARIADESTNGYRLLIIKNGNVVQWIPIDQIRPITESDEWRICIRHAIEATGNTPTRPQTNDYFTVIRELRDRIKQAVIEHVGNDNVDGARDGMEAMALIDLLLGMAAVKAFEIPF